MLLRVLHLWLYQDNHGFSPSRIHLPFFNGIK